MVFFIRYVYWRERETETADRDRERQRQRDRDRERQSIQGLRCTGQPAIWVHPRLVLGIP